MKMQGEEPPGEATEAQPTTQISTRIMRVYVNDNRKNSQPGALYIIPSKRTVRKPSTASTACQTCDETPLLHTQNVPDNVNNISSDNDVVDVCDVNGDVCDVLQVHEKTASEKLGPIYEPPTATHTHTHVALNHTSNHACCMSSAQFIHNNKFITPTHPYKL
eukprot:GHVR01111205.1.p2 GENE.GHVR01111205.1~~GHVR01111205.1.p2  ORF type:complete len:162 (+),score=31.46 GHVR01111205.1:953-1438(+)